jgi:hypothetical protein
MQKNSAPATSSTEVYTTLSEMPKHKQTTARHVIYRVVDPRVLS